MPGLPDDEELPLLSVHAPHVTTIVVTAAVIERGGRFLVTRRQKGVHLEGYWEFPGGKCDADESLIACLARELREELDVGARIGREMYTVTHSYAERSVELHFFVFHPQALGIHLSLLVATAVVAALYPMWLVARLPIATTLRNEVIS